MTLTNIKHESTQPIKDYSNPIRLYANTKTTIACVGMTKIVFLCPTETYANDLVNSIGDGYGTFTVEKDPDNAMNHFVTLELNNSVDSIEMVHTKQTRFRTLTVYYVG